MEVGEIDVTMEMEDIEEPPVALDPISRFEKSKNKYGHIYDLIKLNRIEDIQLIAAHHDLSKVRSPCGGTPLNVASMFHNNEICELLIANGCCIDVKTYAVNAYEKSRNKYAHLYELIRYNRLEDIKFIVEHHDVSKVRSPAGWTPVNIAAMFNNLQIRLLLTLHGCPTDIKRDACTMYTKSKDKYRFLYELIQLNRIEELRVILAQHDLRRIRSPAGATPMHVAAMYNKVQIFELLMQHGCDIEASNDLGETILHWAKGYDSTDIAAIVTQMCPYLAEVRDGTGKTPETWTRKWPNSI